MIRINLLPGPERRAPKARQDGRNEAFIGIGLIVLTLGGCLYYSSVLDSEIESLEGQRLDKQKQVASLKEKVKQVEEFEKKKKELEDKSRIIDQLEKARTGPVMVLDYVSRSLEPLKLWIVRLGVKGSEIELEGRALTNDDVVEFVNNLRRTDYFSSIQLQESRQAPEARLIVYQFRLALRLKG